MRRSCSSSSSSSSRNLRPRSTRCVCRRARQCSREGVRLRGLGALRRLAHCVPCRQDTDYKWQHMPNQMMMALVQDYPYGEMQTSRGGGTHGPPYSLPHEQVRT